MLMRQRNISLQKYSAGTSPRAFMPELMRQPEIIEQFFS